jgi:APA family basic amino acid/polyamine antiporter
MLVIGGIIGAGIFLNPAVVAQRAPTVGLVLGVWILGGAVALAGAFVFAELGSRQPDAGGGYVYLRDGLSPLAGFLYGWTELLVINSGGIAAVSMTFAAYATDLTGAGSGAAVPVAIGAIAALSAVNLLGIRPGAVVQNVLTVLKLAALAALILLGLFFFSASSAPSAPSAPAPSVLVAVGAALTPVLFAYGGWQSTNFVAAEMKAPRRDLPRALVLGVGIVVLVYVLANVVYVNTLGVAGLAASRAPAADVMRRLFGEGGARFIAVGIAVSTFGFLNLAILSAPRVYQAMAADGVFFGRAAKLHDRYRVPTTALLIQSAWAVLLIATKSYGQLLDYVVFGDWIFFGLVGVALFVYRRRAPGAGGGTFRCPGYPLVPAFFVLAAGFAVVSSVASNPGNAALGGAIIAAGIPAYLWWKRTSGNVKRER